jgi:hypothetical protein
MNLRDLPDMSDALAQVRALEEKKKLDDVDPKELKGSHAERKDGDIDNDGDEDESDEYLHNRRKAISKAIKKEEFDHIAFAESVVLELAEEEAIDELTDDELVDIFETALLELADSPEDLLEMADIFESMESEMEYISEEVDTETKREIGGIKRKIAHSKSMDRMVSRSSQLAKLRSKKANNSERDAGAEAREKLSNKPAAQTRGERLKAAAKEAGSRAKKGLKAGIKGAATGAGYVAGAAKRLDRGVKNAFDKGYDRGAGKYKDDGGGSSSSSRPASRPTSSGGTRSGSSSKPREKSALRAVGSLIKKGVKKAVGKTSRLISKGSGALARRLGEEFEKIDHLVESGLFEMTEIEAIILEGIRDKDPEKGTEERKARLEKKRGMNLDDHPQYKKEEVEIVDEGLKGAAKGAALGAAIGTVVPVVGTGVGAAVGAAQGLMRDDRKDKYIKNAKKRAKSEYKNKFEEVDHEEVELFVDLLIDEGADLSEFTWEDMHEEYEMMDEGLRSAVKKLLGGKKKEEPKKPESRGEQLRKKYNVGPEKSDTSAKRQILNRSRARAERDEKEYGGSVYTKSVAKKSKDAHDRYLKAGYSKYGAGDARGKGNKARKRAAALTKEEMVMEGILKRAAEKAKSEYGKYRKFGKASGEAIDRLQRMNQHKQDKYGPSTFKQRMKSGAEHNTDNERKAKEGK